MRIRGLYTGVLEKDRYQFSFHSIRGIDKREIMAYHQGKILRAKLKTSHDYSNNLSWWKREHDKYDVIISPFLQIGVRKVGGYGEITVVKTYMCNIFYDKFYGEKPDPLKDEVKKIIIYDAGAEHNQLDHTVLLGKGDDIGVKTVLPYPKAYEIFKNDENNEYTVDMDIMWYLLRDLEY